MRAAAQTHVGRRRSRNEDALLSDPQRRLFVVADGMGGHPAGDVASRDLIESLDETLTEDRLERCPSEAVGEALREADRHVRAHAQRDRRIEGMGTTAVVAYVTPDERRLVVGNVGDSRVYVLRDGALRQITTDHTSGGLFGGRALSQAIGVSGTAQPEVDEVELTHGDRVLLCSDGLTDMVDDDEIARLLDGDDSVDDRCQALIDGALERGGLDNVTVVLLDIDGAGTG